MTGSGELTFPLVQVVNCLCPKGFGGTFCERTTDICKGMPCYPGVACTPLPKPDEFTCGQCPSKTVSNGKEGYKCFEQGLTFMDYHTSNLIYLLMQYLTMSLCCQTFVSRHTPFLATKTPSAPVEDLTTPANVNLDLQETGRTAQVVNILLININV